MSEEKDVVAYVDWIACIVVSDKKYASSVRCCKCHMPMVCCVLSVPHPLLMLYGSATLREVRRSISGMQSACVNMSEKQIVYMYTV